MISGHSQSLQLTGLGKHFALSSQQQSRLNYKTRVYSAHTKGTRVHLKNPAWVMGEAVPLDPIGYLLHYAMLTRQAVIAALPNT